MLHVSSRDLTFNITFLPSSINDMCNVIYDEPSQHRSRYSFKMFFFWLNILILSFLRTSIVITFNENLNVCMIRLVVYISDRG